MVISAAIRRGLVAAGCIALVGFFMLVRWALDQPLDEKAKTPVRPSEYEIAGGMSVRYRHLHADSISFKVARIRRRMTGAFAMGDFNVLELENVSLNLPLPAETDAVAPPEDAATASPERAFRERRNPLGGLLERIGLSDVGRISGVIVRGLWVGRMTDTGAEQLFFAGEAELRGLLPMFSRCVIVRDGEIEEVPRAWLEMRDGLRLVWPEGSLDLPDLVETGGNKRVGAY